MAIDDWYVSDRVLATLDTRSGTETTLVGAETSDQLSRDPVVIVIDFEGPRQIYP